MRARKGTQAARGHLVMWLDLALVAAITASCSSPQAAKPDAPPKATPAARPKPRVAPAPLPPGAETTLCIAIDTSGSMDARLLEEVRAGVLGAARALGRNDRMAVIAFGDKAVVALPVSLAGDQEAIAAALDGLAAGGHTMLFEGLALSYAVAAEQKTPVRHVVLVTDGLSSDDGKWLDLVNAMTAEGITVSTVGIGLAVDAPKLARLAEWGKGRYWLAQRHEIGTVMEKDARLFAGRRREEAARAHYREIREAWSRKATRPPSPALFEEMRQAYLRYVDMRAAGLQDRDEYRILRATLSRLGAQALAFDPEAAVARAVLDALASGIDWSSGLQEPGEIDALVARAEAEARANEPEWAEFATRLGKVREAFERHLDAPDAPVPEDLRQLLDLLKSGEAIGEPEDALRRKK